MSITTKEWRLWQEEKEKYPYLPGWLAADWNLLATRQINAILEHLEAREGIPSDNMVAKHFAGTHEHMERKRLFDSGARLERERIILFLSSIGGPSEAWLREKLEPLP